MDLIVVKINTNKSRSSHYIENVLVENSIIFIPDLLHSLMNINVRPQLLKCDKIIALMYTVYLCIDYILHSLHGKCIQTLHGKCTHTLHSKCTHTLHGKCTHALHGKCTHTLPAYDGLIHTYTVQFIDKYSHGVQRVVTIQLHRTGDQVNPLEWNW